jgi:hypothetical protein
MFRAETDGGISENMVRSIEHYPSETIVVVHAKLRKAHKRVKNATVHDYELDVLEIHKVGDLAENVPFTVYDADNINRDKEDADDDLDNDATDETPLQSPTPPTRQSTDLSRKSVEGVRKSMDKLADKLNNAGSRSK